MPVRTNGGVFTDQVLSGSMRHFKIIGADFSGAMDSQDRPVFGSAADVIFTKISQRAIIAIMNPISVLDNSMSFALENTSADWNAERLQTMIRSLGIIGVDNVDVSAINVIQVMYDLAYQATTEVLSFTDLSDTPSDYVGQAGKTIAVNISEDGLEFISFPTATIGDAPLDTNVYGRSNGTWIPVVEVSPTDGSSYVRKDGAWVLLVSNLIPLDSTNFNKNLGPADNTVQKAFETLDELDIGFSYSIVSTNQTVLPNNRYFITNNAEATLPDITTLAIGDNIRFAQQSISLGKVHAFTGQSIILENGSLVSTINYNKAVELLFVFDGTYWTLNT